MSAKELIRGRFHPDLEENLFSKVAGAKADEPLAPAVILVGSNLLASYLKRKLAWYIHDKGLGGGHAAVRFLNFRDLASALTTSDLSKEPPQELGSLANRLLSKSVAETAGEGYFGPVSSFPGFPRALARTFDDLDEAAITDIPSQIFSGSSSEKLKDLAALRSKYLDLKGGRLRVADTVRLATARAGDFASCFGSTVIHVYGFYDFTFIQRQLIEALGQHIDIYFYLPAPPDDSRDFAAYREIAVPTLTWLQTIGFTEKTAPNPGSGQVGIPITMSPQVFALSVPNEEREIREIAREIIAHAKKGVHFDEMMIVLVDQGGYPTKIREIFSNCDIPVYMRQGKTLSQTRAGRMLLRLCELASGEGTRRTFMEFADEAGIKDQAWEAISCEAGCTTWPAAFNESLSRYCNALNYGIDRQKEKGAAAGALERMMTKAGSARRLLKLSSDIRGELQSLLSDKTWEASINRLLNVAATNSRLTEDQERKDARQAGERLSKLASLDAFGEVPSLSVFRQFVTDSLQDSPMTQGSFQRGVTVTTLNDARGLSAKVVFMPGLIEGRFPAPSKQDPIILDGERFQINHHYEPDYVDDAPHPSHPRRLRLESQRASEAPLLFDIALNSASEELFCSYPRMQNLTGGKNSPSWFLVDLCERLAGKRVVLSVPNNVGFVRYVPITNVAPSDPENSIDPAEFDLAAMNMLSGALPSHDYLGALYPSSERPLKAIRKRWTADRLTAYDGYISSAEARSALFELVKDKAYGATELEKYANCPFGYFLERLLRVSSYDRPEDLRQADRMKVGTTVHEILHQFFSESRTQGKLPLRFDELEENVARMLTVANKRLDAFERRNPLGYQLQWDMRREDIVAGLERLVEDETRMALESDLIPQDFEVGFDTFTLHLPDGTPVTLKGRIDRVDLPHSSNGATPAELRVIDYKSGNLSQKTYSIRKGEWIQLQLPLYLLVACARYGADIALSSAEYLSTTLQTTHTRTIFEGSDWKGSSEDFFRMISGIVGGIQDGFFSPWPENRCKQCDLRRACAPNPVSSIILKGGSGPMESFAALRDIR